MRKLLRAGKGEGLGFGLRFGFEAGEELVGLGVGVGGLGDVLDPFSHFFPGGFESLVLGFGLLNLFLFFFEDRVVSAIAVWIHGG